MENINNIHKIIRGTLKKSSFYKDKYLTSDYRLRQKEVPFTTKSEILNDQKKNPPFGNNLCVSEKMIQRVHRTSGTTNIPLLIALTMKDVENTVSIGRKCFLSSGLKKEDLVIHCFNYNMWSGGYTDHQNLESTGAGVIPFGVGNTNLLIETILRIRPTAIHCTPSYLVKIEEVLKNEFNLLPKSLKLKKGFFGGESGVQDTKFRERIEEKWGLSAMNANYGLSEVYSMFASEDKHKNGLIFFGGEYLIPELIDIETLKRIPIEKGSYGELVLTHITKEAQPLLRYRTGDIIRIKETIRKNNEFKFEIEGRSDDMIVYKGLNIFPRSIKAFFGNYNKLLNGQILIEISKKSPITKMRIKLEAINREKAEDERNRIEDSFKSVFTIMPEIEFVAELTLPRTEGKTKILEKIL